jgi:hypothetical protein
MDKRRRKKDWSDEAIAFDTGTGEVDVDETAFNREFLREERGEKSTQYEAPKERKWKARNVITIHWQLTGIECPYPSMVYIVACVIDHSNINTGRCDASQRVIALETGYGRNWVRKVLKWVADNTPFLVIEKRERRHGGKFKSHAYHVQWQALELFWIGITDNIEATKEDWRNGDVTEPPCTLKGMHGDAHSRGSTVHAHSRGCSNHESLNHEVGNTSLRVRSDERTIIEDPKGKEEGIQGEQVEGHSPNPPLPLPSPT